MARRPLPLLIDALPLYAGPKALRAAVFGVEYGATLGAITAWEYLIVSPDFPRFNMAMGGWFVPSVIAFFEAREAGGARADRATEEASWHTPTRKRRVAGFAAGPSGAA